MAEAPIDLSRPSPPALIPIRRFKGTVSSRRDFQRDESRKEGDAETQAGSNPDGFSGRPSWSCDIQARLGMPTVTTVQANRKVLRVCVNNNSIPPSNAAPLPGSRMAAMLSGTLTAPLNESTGKWRCLANLSRSRSVPNVTESPVEVGPRRKAMSEERAREGSDDGYDRPRKRRRYVDSLERTRDSGGSEQAWTSQISRKSLIGRHVRPGTGAAPATLKGLRDKILSRTVPAAPDDH